MRKRIVGAAIAAMIGLMSAAPGGTLAAEAATPIVAEFNLPVQALADSLRAVAVETQTSLLFDANGVTGKRAPALKGRVTVDEAVTRLLVGSGLAPRRVDDRTIVLAPAGEAQMQGTAEEMGIRLARADGGSAGETATQQKASAQETTGSASGESGGAKLEEIVVTAQRREERLQDVPISITVLSGERLDASTGRGVMEELSKVPSVALTVQPEGRSFIVVRGVSPQSGVSPVGYYIDMVPVSFVSLALAPDADVYDLQRVEVLKGPQGTSYGIGSASGVVRILTNDPDASKFESKGRVSVSSTEGGGTNYRADAAVNAPIIDGRLAIRGVVGLENWGGWIDRPNKQDANPSDATNIRFKIGGELAEGLSAVAGIWHQKRKSGIDAADANGNRNVLFDEHSDALTDIYSFLLKKDFDAFSLTSSTSYIDLQAGYFKRSIFSANTLITDTRARARSEEITLTSSGAGPWKWTAGVFYRSADERGWTRNSALATVYTAAPNPDESVGSDAYAAFGELGYSFSQFELLTGVRYSKEKGTRASNLSDNYNAKGSFSKVTPRLVLNWKPSRDLTTYLSYSEGFRSGIIQPGTAVQLGFGPVKSDLLRNYELGNKATLFGGMLSWEAAVYYMDWQDVQQSLTFPFGATFLGGTVNATSASGFGGEVSVTLRPVERFEIGGSYSQNDLTVDSNVTSGANLVLFSKGDRLSRSPKTTYGAFADYTAPVGADLEFRFGANLTHVSSRITRLLLGAVTTFTDDALTMAGLNIGIGRNDGSRRVSLFVDNLTDSDAALGNNYASAIPAAGSPDEGLRVRPRTMGLQVEMKF